MRFLCLHGLGTNNEIFETQTEAAIRYELGDHHTFEYVEGVLPCTMAPEIRSYISTDYECFAYYEHGSSDSAKSALENLEAYIQREGPFDGVMAFSQGACLAIMLMAQQAQNDLIHGRQTSPIFKCAILFSGAVVEDPVALIRNEVGSFEPTKDAQLIIHMPVANIWATNDKLISESMVRSLSGLFDSEKRTEFVHEEGHEVPKTKTAVIGAVNAIRRAIGMVEE